MNTSPSPLRLEVGLQDRAYDILIGAGLLARAGDYLKPIAKGRVFIVPTKNTGRHHLVPLQNALAASGLAVARAITLSPGESTKSFGEIEKLVLALLENGLERGDLIVALGGGVVGDMAGFAAAIALRGVAFVQVPTTLLAQVDSSIGGKTGIDTAFGKNTIGAFHQPRLVLIDPLVLRTLSLRDLRAGYAELMKHALIEDEPFFAWLEAHGSEIIGCNAELSAEAIYRSCAIKARIVASDERETGPRALLNLGHTFAHGLESEFGYSAALLHGEAVAIGCRMAASLSQRLGLCPLPDILRLEKHMSAVGLPLHYRYLSLPPVAPERLLEWMRRDKKAQGGRPALVLLKGIGKAFLTREVEEGALLAFLRDEII